MLVEKLRNNTKYIILKERIEIIKLPYGTGFLNLDVEPNAQINVLEPESHSFKISENQEEIVRKALNFPINSPKLKDLVNGKSNIVIITSDHTRPVPSHITLPILLEEIKNANPNAKVTLLISTGLHRPSTEEEMLNKFGKELLQQVEVINHKAEVEEDMVFLGNLPSGGELWINKIAVEADLVIGEGFIEPHFFAGFSGGRKSILPGIASRKTVLFNHNAKFIDNRNARAGILEDNPIHKDMVWAVEQTKMDFILNVVINSKKEIINCVAGHPIESHYEGCKFVHRLTSVDVKPADIVISTNGGYPLDQNLYQAVKGMTAAEASAKPGAVIIILAKCEDGLGGEHFYHQLADYPSPQVAMDRILAIPSEETELDQWQSQILARILVKHHVIVVCDEKIAKYVGDMHMQFSPTIDKALEKARELKGKNASITVIPDGVGVIGVLAE